MARRLVDWTAMKAEWAASEESLTKFADRKGVALSAVKKHAAADDWDVARSTFRADVATQTLTEKAKFRARSEADIDNRAHLIADDLTTVIQTRLRNVIGRDPDGKPVLKADADVSALDLKLMSDALKNGYELQRVTAGLPRQKTPDRIQVEASLEVATGVVMLPELKEE